VSSSIRPKKRENGRQLTDQTGQTNVAPAGIVLERAEYVAGLAPWSEDPHGDEDCEEAEDVKD
jgi:hypothetical protein